MKITIKNTNKLVPFEEIAEGTVFKDPDFQDRYYLKTVSVLDENGEEDLNCLSLENYTLDYFDPGRMVYPIYDAELVIP